MRARERAFLRGIQRLAEGGRRLNVDESRAAGKPSSPLFLGLVRGGEGREESSMTIGMKVFVATYRSFVSRNFNRIEKLFIIML